MNNFECKCDNIFAFFFFFFLHDLNNLKKKKVLQFANVCTCTLYCTCLSFYRCPCKGFSSKDARLINLFDTKNVGINIYVMICVGRLKLGTIKENQNRGKAI